MVRVSLNGAAQESNLPSRGLHDLTGFEDLGESAQPIRLQRVRASVRASQSSRARTAAGAGGR
jgi:hypothetical protein